MRTTVSSPPSQNSHGAASAPLDDARLVALAKGDPRAFAPLYDRYFDPVYRYCYRRLGHPEAAADATAQVFTKALAALPRYREDAPSFRSWLFAIAHNVITDDLRARRPVAPMIAAEQSVRLSRFTLRPLPRHQAGRIEVLPGSMVSASYGIRMIAF